LPVIIRKDSIDLFAKYKVYSERELHSRFAILAENYVKTVNIEGQLMTMMAKTMILPAALRYQGEVATAVNAAKAAGVDNSAQAELLKSLTATISDFQRATLSLEKALAHHADGDAFAHAKYFRDHVLPAMSTVRNLGDKLEGVVADDLWPLPTYREMLFIK
jgi:glutamine synthetase